MKEQNVFNVLNNINFCQFQLLNIRIVSANRVIPEIIILLIVVYVRKMRIIYASNILVLILIPKIVVRFVNFKQKFPHLMGFTVATNIQTRITVCNYILNYQKKFFYNKFY